MKNLYYDVVIAGCGVAGLYAALNLPEEMNILMLSKKDLESCDSMLAQGGICVLRDESDYDSYFEDTMRAGHYENRKESVDIMIRSSRDVINDLLNFGVRFAKNPDGSLAYTREGAHSRPRICFHEDITGKEITTTLLSHVKKCSNVTILEYTTMISWWMIANAPVLPQKQKKVKRCIFMQTIQLWQPEESGVFMSIPPISQY